MDIEWIKTLGDAVTKDGAWATFSLILLIALICENRANRRVTLRSTEALTALKTLIETIVPDPVLTASKKKPTRRGPKR